LGVDSSQIEAFELTAGARKLALKRDGENWIAASGAQPDREAVELWLHDLAGEKARAFLPPGPVTHGARLVLTLAGDKHSTIVVVGTAPDRNLLVRRDEEPVVLAFHPELADALDPSGNRFASLEPWGAHQPSEVVALEAHADALRRTLSVDQGRWLAPSKPPLDAEADLRVRELVKSLMKLRIRAFVADHPRPEHGLASPRAGVVLHLVEARGSAREQNKDGNGGNGGDLRLEIGTESEHGAYARLDGSRVVELTAVTVAQVRELAGGERILPLNEPDAGSEGPDELEDLDHHHIH
jgi:hypothetical protein